MVDKASHRWQQLLLQLEDPQPLFVVGQDCDACRDELPLFVTDELMGKSVDTLYSKTAQHLDQCPVCLVEYELLATLLAESIA